MLELLDSGFVLGQLRSGVTTAIFLFLIASGLSLIFGVLRIINFAHGSLYMIGAYIAWDTTARLPGYGVSFWASVLVAACVVAVLGAVVERCLLRFVYRREEHYQLLFTYALVLIFSDAAKILWGTEAHSVSRPHGLAGSVELGGVRFPTYELVILAIGSMVVIVLWLSLNRTGYGRIIRAAALDREMLGALGTDVSSLYTTMFMAASFLAGLSGALITPIRSVVPGMDVEIIVDAFIVVVIGGLGSLWGTLLGSLVYGMVLAFGIVIFPRFSIFAAFALMALVLIIRPWGLLGRPIR
ncbi:MAG: branched-chain amino acid ABC transporter permease [Hyphomonadaceae bacterium]|nr:branched-chain amino acid ABC transporter permease [Hyphomonadaceae bacterium]